jgi:hypothetical protein
MNRSELIKLLSKFYVESTSIPEAVYPVEGKEGYLKLVGFGNPRERRVSVEKFAEEILDKIEDRYGSQTIASGIKP